MLLNGGCVFDDDGCDVAAVFDLKDGDKELRLWRPGLLGLVIVDVTEEVSTAFFSLDVAALILVVVTFLFFFDGDTIVNANAE